MNREELIAIIRKKKSFLCVGLDTDITKIPSHLLKAEDPVFEFNKHIIDATIEHSIAYKPNIAFYESMGLNGWISLKKTIDYLEQYREEVFVIADAKRGDIGNTSAQYARTFFDKNVSGFDFDAITVAPYMGEDSVSPFLSYKNKWVIILALTSNKGVNDFQFQKIIAEQGEKKLFELVLEKSKLWGTDHNIMYVVGATQAEMLTEIRNIVPEHFLLVPGIGAQGGSLEDVVKFGINSDCGLIVNASRSILYASQANDFAEKAYHKAKNMKNQMELLLKQYSII